MKLKEIQYAKTLYALTKDKSPKEINGVVSNFIKILAKNGQIKLATKIIQKFNEIWNASEGIVETEVISFRKLDKSELHKIEKYIEEKYLPATLRLPEMQPLQAGVAMQASKAKKIVIHEKIDKSIKGGIIIKVKDDVLDGSIANQLKMLKINLSK